MVSGSDVGLPPIAKSEKPTIPVLCNTGVLLDPVVGTCVPSSTQGELPFALFTRTSSVKSVTVTYIGSSKSSGINSACKAISCGKSPIAFRCYIGHIRKSLVL
jgi:hypothetical protein